ncbi:MAG TPA: tetratricopeptide repeat protein [Thermodesulfobacteriota bacterium]|nr:tetratricopeptide repeat protein [Thermodesulfobacteriota bacterium]
MTKKIKLLSVETALFVLVILLLSVGTYSRNRTWDDEIGLWTDCINKSPHKARPYLNLGVAYFDKGAYDKSFEATQKAVQLDPKNGDAYYNLGLNYQKMGNLKEAIAMEKKSLELDPTLDMAYYSLGGIYFENGRYEEAEESFQRFLKIYPYAPEVHGLLAIVYAAQKKFDKAVTELEWEIRINPRHTLAHLNLGQIYWYEFQDRRKALFHLKTALRLDPLIPNRAEILQLVRLLEGFP